MAENEPVARTSETPTLDAPPSIAIDPPAPIATAISVDAVATPGAATTSASGGADSRYLLLTIVALLTLAAAYIARPLLVPIVFSILAGLVLAPPVRLLVRLHVPRFIATLLVVILALSATAVLVGTLAEPAQQLMENAPRAIARLEARLAEWRRPLKAATDATESLRTMAEGTKSQAPQRVMESAPGPMMMLLQQAPSVLGTTLVSVFLVFLLLLHGDHLLRKFVELMPGLSAKKELVLGTREAQHELSRYLVLLTVINSSLGLITAGALQLVGISDPLLWAGVVALFNFAPYIGPFAVAVLLTGAGFSQFDSIAEALIAPGVFLSLHAIEGQVVTPLLVGRHLALDPVVIFIGLMLFGWLWGIIGLLLAVPMLACFKIVAQRLPGGGTWAKLLTV